MEFLRGTMRRFRRSRAGATAIEYSLIACLISVAIIASIQALGSAQKNSFNKTADAVTEAAAS